MRDEKNNTKEEELLRKKLEMLANIRKQHEWITMGQTEVSEADSIDQELEDNNQEAEGNK